MTQPLLSILFSGSARPGASRFGCENNPELERSFPLVPDPKITKKCRARGTKNGLAAKFRHGDAAG
jgi:hypothetical protein